VVVVVRLANSELALEDSDPVASGDYWRRIFENNPSFSSWHEAKQSEVKNEIVAKLRQGRVPLRVLDYGIGNMGLYRCLDGDLMDSLDLTGVSESQQHDADDELISRFRVNVVVGSGLSPLFAIPSGSKDRIISSYVFAYLDDSIRADLLREFARILAPTGELILAHL
jgi:SAM-dependent methyltransferase